MKTYNDDIMYALRQANGLEEEDASLDNKIMSMDKKKCLINIVLGTVCLDVGLIIYWKQLRIYIM